MDKSVTTINAIGFIIIAVMALLMIILPRRYATLPLIITATYITFGQVLSVESLQFTAVRIIIFVGILRIIIRREFATITFNKIDTIIILYACTLALFSLLRRQDAINFTHSLGFVYDALGSYIIFRSLVRNADDYYMISKMMVFVMLPLAATMIFEKTTGRNIFSIFGGVPEYTIIRDGRLRCQGAFAHPILAGTFASTSIPFFITLWVKGKKQKILAVLGIVLATIITITTASSGPVMVYGAVIFGVLMWRLRDSMRIVRLITLFMIIGLHLFMQGPVWELIGKLGHLMGGTGWHRVMLINAAVEHFNEWWLYGSDYTRHWMPTGTLSSANHSDITNQFIGIGVKGGILPLVIFVAILFFCFRACGLRMKEIDPAEFPLKFTIWCLGVALFSHIVAFTSVAYFDQIFVFWYLLLAIIASLTASGAKIRDSRILKV